MPGCSRPPVTQASCRKPSAELGEGGARRGVRGRRRELDGRVGGRLRGPLARVRANQLERYEPVQLRVERHVDDAHPSLGHGDEFDVAVVGEASERHAVSVSVPFPRPVLEATAECSADGGLERPASGENRAGIASARRDEGVDLRFEQGQVLCAEAPVGAEDLGHVGAAAVPLVPVTTKGGRDGLGLDDFLPQRQVGQEESSDLGGLEHGLGSLSGQGMGAESRPRPSTRNALLV